MTGKRFVLDANKSYLLHVKDAEYESSEVLASKVSPTYLFFDILFGLVPLIIDYGTGSIYYFQNVEIEKEAPQNP
ncbi:hypothetical protein Ctha_1233 [Chloroherpeton thalassium ATCC 35110]|uniref:Uncharacterized protein n=1 Tax=Chloroherpeton thalassium (strain ATCC 35110 / GB-78) TaxID=517418 RepID=B3QZ03_CHLT3|nr:hypothetical protein [Chloroherpeton thalassium]ACF13696.1 hypothetical protein Ctha_1233 [Chloroherpeton thalassium ATCC 35110]